MNKTVVCLGSPPQTGDLDFGSLGDLWEDVKLMLPAHMLRTKSGLSQQGFQEDFQQS